MEKPQFCIQNSWEIKTLSMQATKQFVTLRIILFCQPSKKPAQELI